MLVLDDVDRLPAALRFVVAVGMFDGVHRGHARMLSTGLNAARQLDARLVVITFDPHPEQVLRGVTPPLLCDVHEKLGRLARAGVEVTAVQRFDSAFAEQPAADFLRRLAADRRLVGVVMTDETAFGRDRAGTLATVEGLALDLGFRVVHVPQLLVGGRRISSGRIRDLLAEGRIGPAKRLLGRDYAVIGEVVRGDGRGRELGFPTANLRFEQPMALPSNGIYAVRVSWGGHDPLEPFHLRGGVASLGVRPTFGPGERLLEAFLFDFEGDLYGRRLRVEFIRRQRGERKFVAVGALIGQMRRDAERARAILADRAA